MDKFKIKNSDCLLMWVVRSRTTLWLIVSLLFIRGCSEDFLVITPNGELSQAVLATYEGVDALLIGAYSMLDGLAEGTGGWAIMPPRAGFSQASELWNPTKGAIAAMLPTGINSIQTYHRNELTNPYHEC